MGVDEQETVEVVGGATAQMIGREADAMHALLVKRADLLMGCRSAEDEELRTLTEVIETYEARRWPTGKDAGGKG